MSWVKRRGQTTPSATSVPPGVQMYNPNQHPVQEVQQQSFENNWKYQQQQQQQQPQPQPQSQPKEDQPPQGQYWMQNYNNQNVHHQYPNQTGYYQNNSGYQQGHENVQYDQQYNQNSIYPTQKANEGDSWNEWSGWGDEDNSNVQTRPQQSQNLPAVTNNIAESFANDASWNWPTDDAQTKTSKNDELFPKIGIHPTHAKIDADTYESGRKNKLDPQWSLESKMSQESFDDTQQTSDSEKSHMLSRSSTISHSPISGQDLAPASIDEHLQLRDANQLHVENKEIVPQTPREELKAFKTSPTPPPATNIQTPPLLPPPSNSDDMKNPYKRSTTLSHKAANKFRPIQSQSPNYPPFHSQSVNLETLPDNSEQPDSIPTNQSMRKLSNNKSPKQWAENNEAPINDRNQYLETGQLSDVDFNQPSEAGIVSIVENDTLPPPGLRRMVLGQIEQNENDSGGNSFGDEPPPGLSRMVLGQIETGPVGSVLLTPEPRPFQPIEPPEGLHRMIPGESSSPESALRQQSNDRRQDDSEAEFNEIGALVTQPRSATIGADTPPVSKSLTVQTTNRSETIGADTSPGSQLVLDNSRGKDKSSSRKTNGNRNEEQASTGGNRRNSVERHQDLVSSVRNLTVGDNPADGPSSSNNLESNVRRHSRQESSGSEHEPRSKSPRERRDRRYKEERDRNRERYSPESYRDKKYDRRRYKERRYEEDTDYYSDKEKDRRRKDDRDRDYDRKYSSLRKEKDKDRRRKDPRDYERDSRKNYYYRYEDDYENEPRSRTSSRSDSMHETYRDRGHDRDRHDRRHKEKAGDRHRRHRETEHTFNPFTQGFGYDMYNQYYQQYHYYENLRKTNPQAYAQLYRQYYQRDTEDRASVHSGRSSANDELAKDRYTRQSYYSQTSLPQISGGYYRESQMHSISGQYGFDDPSFTRPFDQTDNSLNYEDPNLAAQRLTPAKYATAHIKASISSGKLLKISPHYPLDGHSATIDLCNLGTFLGNDEEYMDLKRFPGPLIKGVTHKKTVIEYCESKIKGALYNVEINDPESYILMWELLILLLRQNGMVVGTDIAELLLKNRNTGTIRRSASAISSIASNVAETPELSSFDGNAAPTLKEEEITNKFREYLLYGSGKEALEWAMKHGLWGHALFLASKLDKRTYANVMMRFANGLTMNDPLQTLYQLLSGKIPAAVTCVADEKWGDWRPHLAMILSNSTQRPELNCKAITSLGDTLMGRGSLYAAQFCYLMAEVNFNAYGQDGARLVLLGSNHNSSFSNFATNEAIHMTEIYEYACGLNDDNFSITEFQQYKYLLSTRLADMGLLEKALSYLERISGVILKNPSAFKPSLINDVTILADRLKYYDPIGDAEEDTGFGIDPDTSRPDNSWLKDLRRMGLITREINNLALATSNFDNIHMQPQSFDSNNQDVWQQHQYDQHQQWNDQQQQQQQSDQIQSHHGQQDDAYFTTQYQDQSQYWSNQQQWPQEQASNYGQESVNQQHQNYYGSVTQTEPNEVEKKPPEDIQQPQVSMPNQSKGKSPYDDDIPLTDAIKKKSLPKPKPEASKENKQESGRWFGGIFSKLSLKPKNQMKLPDDKNPSIVWDQEQKRWVNTEEDNGDGAGEFKPPPKMADIMPKMPPGPGSVAPLANMPFNQPIRQDLSKMTEPVPPQLEVNGNTPISTQPNIFKLQRGRNLKKSYIDVFNPTGGNVSSASLPPSMGAPQPIAPQINFFIPKPVDDPNAPTDFLTPAPPLHYDEQSQLQAK